TISVMGETCMAYPEGCAVVRNSNTCVLPCGGGKSYPRYQTLSIKQTQLSQQGAPRPLLG
ncbi:MAG: hypothetical protein K2I99_06925, partial [Bacteroidaceae bacterium]|nr:hypothetical protein [Bacteroidaceae bacterium]